MVANCALAPDSKLAVEEWAKEDVFLDGGEQIQVQHLYRAMDFLLDNEESIQHEVFWSVANLLNLEVDVIFFDTTSTYGYSKDKRGDLSQIVIGLAVTKEGIPIRSWVFPGNTPDGKTVDQIQKDLTGWRLGRMVWVMLSVTRGVIRRSGTISKVTIGCGVGRRRFVVVYNPEQDKKDKAMRERVLERIEKEIQAIGDLEGRRHTQAICALLSHPYLGKYVKELKSGRLEINRSKVSEEEKLDGKYLLSSSDDTLTAEEIALGYKQLFEVERVFRTLKTTLELRPIYHRKDERIRSHVTLCWLALLLVRIIEVETGQTWERIRKVLSGLHMGIFSTKNGCILQRSELTREQSNILKKLKIKPPPLIKNIDLNP